MKDKNINYIETTLNGYVIKRVKICEYEKDKDYYGELKFKLNGEEKDYHEDFCGDYSELDKFIENKSHYGLISYQDVNHLDTHENVYLEYWKTDSVGWYEDKYIGIEISNKKEVGKNESICE